MNERVELPEFQRVQQVFAAHLRDPERKPAPPGVDPRRMGIYRELIFNNVAGFVRSGFPVLCDLLGPARSDGLVREFLVGHRAASPYFLDIGREFIAWLQDAYQAVPGDPGFLLELAHYEWVELALDVAETDYPVAGIDPGGDLLSGHPLVSPLAWSLVYRYPVHRLGPGYRPEAPPAQPTFLVVYRNRAERVRFLEANAVTARLLALLQAPPARCGAAVLCQIAAELGRDDVDAVVAFGARTLEELRALHIIAGVVPAGG